tara:strand:+ start:328 stop:939 length:612 start_codon:yes stop_codon:yes gene_type:complete
MIVRVSSACCERSSHKVFDNISFELKNGQIGFISGSNGSGKTSLLRMVAGLISLSSGTISYGPLFDLNTGHNNDLFLLGHNLAIKEDITPDADIKFWSNFLGSSNKKDALKRVGLSNLKKTPCKYLSQGQKQRLGIARLMVSNKSLWLLDEPTSSLDSDSSVLLKDIITEHTKFGGSVLVSSHSEFLDNIDFKIDLDNKNVSI